MWDYRLGNVSIFDILAKIFVTSQIGVLKNGWWKMYVHNYLFQSIFVITVNWNCRLGQALHLNCNLGDFWSQFKLQNGLKAEWVVWKYCSILYGLE